IVAALRREKPVIVNAGTPKAGFLVIMGATIARIPHRVYTLRGLRFETETGFKRRVLMLLEAVTCRLAQKVICISPSLQRQAVEYGIVPWAKTVVLGSGSSNGVDTSVYTRTADRDMAAAS